MRPRWAGWVLFILTVTALAALTACGEKSKAGSVASNGAGDPEKGRRVYMATCISCHNPDPSKDGPIGPAVKGSSRELIEARVLYQSYPPGYTPKRNTALMPKQPQLANDISNLAAYLSP